MIGANGSVREEKDSSLARWPPNPSRCWALTWRTIGPMEDYWARSGGLLAEWPLSTSGGVFPLTSTGVTITDEGTSIHLT